MVVKMDKEKKQWIRRNIREIALTIFFSGLGMLILFVLKEFEFSKLIGSIIAFVIAALATFILFPKVFGIPFGRINIKEWTRRIGLYLTQNGWMHIILGICLAICTLSGMLIASILTGKYVLDLDNITLAHMVFSLIPGIFEEIFFRGILMIILLKITKSLEKAFTIQVVIFGLLHIKYELNIMSLVDAISVLIIAIGLTYSVYKTRTLITAIIFHYLHDAFLFVVQLPDGVYQGFTENALFYVGLWIMVGIGILITKIATDKFQVQAKEPLYEKSYS
jgi:membrane protease YdiL (CAAX protease family)